MREILFRGQTRRLGEKVWMNGEKVPSNWVYGGVCHGKYAFSIIYGSMDEERENPIEKHVVYTDTVGQYTGLTDKNGKKIFEGDIVVCSQEINGNFIDKHIEIGYVEMKHGAFGLHRKQGYYRPFKDWLEDYEYEVIGNIHDNPELLKGGE